MSIDPQTIAKGKCYKTATNQHRRVYDVTGDLVTYESWSGPIGNHVGNLHRDKISRDGFAQAVEAEIPCPININPLP